MNETDWSSLAVLILFYIFLSAAGWLLGDFFKTFVFRRRKSKFERSVDKVISGYLEEVREKDPDDYAWRLYGFIGLQYKDFDAMDLANPETVYGVDEVRFSPLIAKLIRELDKKSFTKDEYDYIRQTFIHLVKEDIVQEVVINDKGDLGV